MNTKEEKIERGSGNVFADLGRPDAEAHLLKAAACHPHRQDHPPAQDSSRSKRQRCWDCPSPDVSRLLRGNFREYSVERLLRLLTALGRDVEIVIHEPDPRANDEAAAQLTPQRKGRLSVAA